MSRQPKLRPKLHISGVSDAMYEFSTAPSLSLLESRRDLGEEKPDQRVFRVKRKHVLKACDRCRVKKTKCDGKQPCNRCSAYNHPCLFRERKATQPKVYSRGCSGIFHPSFVEMLESHHSLVVKALQRLYKLCVGKEGFPGEPLTEATDGYPLTHAILDRLGLIKQAEEISEEPEEESEDLQYLRFMSNSTDCSATADPSPEPATPPDPPLSTCSPVNVSPGGPAPFKWDFHPSAPPTRPESYHGYPQAGYQGLVLLRPALEPVSVPTEVKCAVPVPSSATDQGQSYLYYADSRSNGDSTTSRVQLVVTTGPGPGPGPVPAITPSGMPSGTVEEYSLQLQSNQHIYPSFASGWTYPCG